MALVVDELRKNSGRLWTDATGHPFITELGAGSLPDYKFRRYFVQDYVFVNQLAKVAGLAVAKAPDLNAARPFGDLPVDAPRRRGFLVSGSVRRHESSGARIPECNTVANHGRVFELSRRARQLRDVRGNMLRNVRSRGRVSRLGRPPRRSECAASRFRPTPLAEFISSGWTFTQTQVLVPS